MACSPYNVATTQDDPTKWVQIEDTVVPVVQKRLQDEGRGYDMLPWPVIKYGVNLPGQLALTSYPATPAECRHLSNLCQEAGFEFHFGEGTELIRLVDFLRSYGDRVHFHRLPSYEPFQYLTTLTGNNDQYGGDICFGTRGDFNDPDQQPVDLSTHRSNSWTIDRDLEEAVSVINDPHNKLCYKIPHKASIRSIKGQKILCLEQDNNQYVTLQKLYTAFFSRLPVSVFTGIIKLIGVPLTDLPVGYRNITDSIPEKMILADDVPMAIHRLEAELNRIQKVSSLSLSKKAAVTHLDNGTSRKETKYSNIEGQGTCYAFMSVEKSHRTNHRVIGDRLINKQYVEPIVKDTGTVEDLDKGNVRHLGETENIFRCYSNNTITNQVLDTKGVQIVNKRVNTNGRDVDELDGKGADAKEIGLSLKREKLYVDITKDKGQGLDSCIVNTGKCLNGNGTASGQTLDCGDIANKKQLGGEGNQQPVGKDTAKRECLAEDDTGSRAELDDTCIGSEQSIIGSGSSVKQLIKSCEQEVRGNNGKQLANSGRNILDKTKHLDEFSMESEGCWSEAVNKNGEQQLDVFANNEYHHTINLRKVGLSSTYDKRKRLLEKISQIKSKKLKYI